MTREEYLEGVTKLDDQITKLRKEVGEATTKRDNFIEAYLTELNKEYSNYIRKKVRIIRPVKGKTEVIECFCGEIVTLKFLPKQIFMKLYPIKKDGTASKVPMNHEKWVPIPIPRDTKIEFI